VHTAAHGVKSEISLTPANVLFIVLSWAVCPWCLVWYKLQLLLLALLLLLILEFVWCVHIVQNVSFGLFACVFSNK